MLNPLQGRLRWTLPCARALAFTGALSGLLSGLLGVGGGFVIIPALNRYTNLRMATIVSTSLAVIALVSAGSVISASLAGVLHWQVGGPFAVGAVLGLLLARPWRPGWRAHGCSRCLPWQVAPLPCCWPARHY